MHVSLSKHVHNNCVRLKSAPTMQLVDNPIITTKYSKYKQWRNKKPSINSAILANVRDNNRDATTLSTECIFELATSPLLLLSTFDFMIIWKFVY